VFLDGRHGGFRLAYVPWSQLDFLCRQEKGGYVRISFITVLKISRLDDLAVFVRTAEVGSFSEAARRMNLSPAVASAAIKRLEDSLGMRLFERTTRRLRLSKAGERYLPHAREALQALTQGEATLDDADSREGALRGPLRLGLPSDLARSHLLGWIEDYLTDQPKGATLAIELRVSDRVADLFQQPIDLAIRYGALEDSGLIALPLAPENRRVLCAAPSYLARRGAPQNLAELARHNCLRFMVGDTVHSRWRFEGPGPAQVVQATGDRIADDSDIVRRWALCGLGIAYKSRLDVAEDLAAGRLRHVLPQVVGERAMLMMLVVSRERLTPGVRRLATYLAVRCQSLVDALPLS
jgi:DNA-binding transcriptional LysR family regulator